MSAPTWSKELIELLGRAVAAENYKSPEEAYADGVSRQYCEESVVAMLNALDRSGVSLCRFHGR